MKTQTSQQLNGTWLKSSLIEELETVMDETHFPQIEAVKKVLNHAVFEVRGKSLVIKATRAAYQVLSEVIAPLEGAITSYPGTIDKAIIQLSDPIGSAPRLTLKLKPIALPLHKGLPTMQTIKTAISMADAAGIIFQHDFSATMTDMLSGRPILGHKTLQGSGITEAAYTGVVSNNDYFPPDQLAKYLDAVYSATTGFVVCEWKARLITGPMATFKGEVGLFTIDGRPFRICKLLRDPVAVV